MRTAAVVGLGDISPLHLDAITENPEIELVAVCDTNPERAAAGAETWGVKSYTDHQAMLAEAKPDVVHVTLPHSSHGPVALDSLAAGSHVLTEKPLSHTLGSAEEVARLSKTYDRKFGVCFQNRYNPTSVAFKAAIDSGRYGDVLGARGAVWWSRPDAYYAASPWRGMWDQAGGGVLINQTIHTIDLLCWFLGAPTDVVGQAANLTHRSSIQVEDTATIMLTHPGGVKTTYFATNTHWTNNQVEIEIGCTEAMLRMADGQLLARRPDGSVEFLAEDAKAAGPRGYWGRSHAALIEDFYGSLDGPAQFWIDADAALVSLSVLRNTYVQSGLVPAANL